MILFLATSDVTSTRSGQPNKPMQPEDFQRIETELQEHLSREKQQKQEDRLRRESWGLKDHNEDAYADLLSMQSFIGKSLVSRLRRLFLLLFFQTMTWA